MLPQNLDLYKYLADIIQLPMIQEVIEMHGGTINSNKILWPLTTVYRYKVYYTIDTQSRCVYFQGVRGKNENKLMNNEKEILFVLNHLLATIRLSMLIANTPDLEDPVLAINLAQNPKNIPFHVFDSMS